MSENYHILISEAENDFYIIYNSVALVRVVFLHCLEILKRKVTVESKFKRPPCLLAPCLCYECCLAVYNKTGFTIYFLFFFPLDASLLSFPLFLFYVLYLSDLGGGRYCTDKCPHPLPHPHTHTPVLSKPLSTLRICTSHALLLPTHSVQIKHTLLTLQCSAW